MKLSVFEIVNKLLNRVKTDENDPVVSYQKEVTVFMGLLTAVFVSLLALLGVTGPQQPFFIIANIFLFISVVVLSVIFLKGMISMNMLMTFFAVAISVECCSEMLYASIHFSVYNLAVILVNMSVLLIVVLGLILAYVPKIPLIMSASVLCVYIICCVLSTSPIMYGFMPIYLMLFIIASIAGNMVVASLRKLQSENERIARIHSDFVNAMSSSDDDYEINGQQADEPSKNVYAYTKNLAYMIEQDKIDYDNLKDRLPQLTRSELEICTLILKGYKLGDMVSILGKSSSNITCQRTNIRSKLGLGKKENLRDVLAQIASK